MIKRLLAGALCLITMLNLILLSSCTKNTDSQDKTGVLYSEKYADFELSEEKLQAALDNAILKLDTLLLKVGTKFPEQTSTDNVYGIRENKGGWTTGFWVGMLWQAYELSEYEKYKMAALSTIESFEYIIDNKIGVNHHDMGFLFSLSCVSAYKLTGNETAKETALKAADHLVTRYRENGSFIQAWGNISDTSTNYRLIIDTLMNLPLLYWASEVTGDDSYREIARAHYDTTQSLVYREDGSTYHTYYFNPETGKPTKGVTRQGLNDESTWSRGQGWGIYGPMLTYGYENNAEAIETFKSATNYFLENLPADYVPFWDFTYGDGDYQPKDSSAAAIALCGILEGIKHMDESDPLREVYINASKRIMNSLIDNYSTAKLDYANGLLLHGTQNMPDGDGVDEMSIWGDYFYLESLHRMLDPEWEPYW